MNTTDFLNIAAAICPDKTAIVFEDKRYTFSQLNERVNRLANGLMKLGAKKGAVIAFLQVNCNQCVETYFAVAKTGAIYLPLNFRAKEKELTYMLNTAEASVLIAGERYIAMIKSIQPELKHLKHLVSIETKHPDMHYYEDIIKDVVGGRGRRPHRRKGHHHFNVHRRHHRLSQGRHALPQQLHRLRAGERYPARPR